LVLSAVFGIEYFITFDKKTRMKNFTKLFTLLMLPAASFAQITITQSDIPTIGAVWGEVNDTIAGQSIGAGGATQTWNFTFAPGDTTFSNIQSPSVTPSSWQSNFPNANLVNYIPSDSTAAYVKVNSTGLYFDGFYDGTMGGIGALDYNPDYLLIPVPFTYNNTRNNTVKSLLFVNFGVPAKIVSNIQQTFLADAYGSITTPAGTFSNTLRIKSTDFKHDSIYVDFGTGYTFYQESRDTSITYFWLRNGNNLFVAQMDAEYNNPLVATSATYYNNNLTVGAKEIAKNTKSQPYPNPAANSIISFNVDEKATNVTIYDLTGKKVFSDKLRNVNKFQMHSSNLENGVYIYQVTDGNNQIISTGKFNVVN